MRLIALALAAGAAAAVFGASVASAQSSATYPYCLLADDAQICYYTSMAQCMASRRGAVDFCKPNNLYSGSPGRPGMR